MKEIAQDTPGANLIWGALEGGPENLPEASRLQAVGPLDDKIKIAHYGGYEHFERTDRLDEGDFLPRVVFRWTTRTEMAE